MLQTGNRFAFDVFLGGTTNNSNWRDTFIDILTSMGSKLVCFNPVVANWNDQAIRVEKMIKEQAKHHVYVITPKMKGIYSIAEAVESVFDRSHKTYLYILLKDEEDLFSTDENDPIMKSFAATGEIIRSHGGIFGIGSDLHPLVNYIINYEKNSVAIRTDAWQTISINPSISSFSDSTAGYINTIMSQAAESLSSEDATLGYILDGSDIVALNKEDVVLGDKYNQNASENNTTISKDLGNSTQKKPRSNFGIKVNIKDKTEGNNKSDFRGFDFHNSK